MEKKKFMVTDCETATLEFADNIAKADPEKKKRIAIARPLIYDLGWTICDRTGYIYKKCQYLIAEIFCVPSIFDTAYYKDKKPLYLEKLTKGEIEIKPWNEVMKLFIEDMNSVSAVGAFNSMFDFKKAIPFTDLYISKYYSDNFYEWQKAQYSLCEVIANKAIKRNEKESDRIFENDIFRFRGKTYPLFDLWGLAVDHLLNTVAYKRECLNHGLLTDSGLYFKTSAESTYRYLCNKYDFDEAHTALEDAIIETFILSRIAAKHKITTGIKYFPFKDLGYTDEFCMRKKNPDKKEVTIVYEKISAYVDSKGNEISPYISGLIDRLATLEKSLAYKPRIFLY